MKKIQFGIMAVASIIGVGTAFTSKAGKAFAPQVFAIKSASGTYTYTSVAPTSPLTCTTSTEACTISTTIPLATLNNPNGQYRTGFPAQNTSAHPYVRYVTPLPTVYK